MRRLDRAAREMNPFLLALVIGLVILNLTCLAALRLSRPAASLLGHPLTRAVAAAPS